MRADRIIVGGIKFHAYHGLTKLERHVGVRCSIDVEMSLDLSRAIASDGLSDTIDYRKVHEIVLDIGRKGASYHLIESVAGRIASEILRKFPISEVTVRVRKETPVLDGIVDYVGVEVTRVGKPAPRRARGAR
ncbi:MAG TPA: dihydroneopterin aldolase [Verrucomicrobiae bacterium]|nr:dihydroneopterin aldolase [Verrucomicrobiae bacterium]